MGDDNITSGQTGRETDLGRKPSGDDDAFNPGTTHDADPKTIDREEPRFVPGEGDDSVNPDVAGGTSLQGAAEDEGR